MGAQHGLVDRGAIETFGGIEFQRVVDPQHIGRADLRHHVGGDQHHDLVEAFLSADLLRHHFAEPSQQDAGATRRAPHVLNPLPAWPARSVSAAPALSSRKITTYLFGTVPTARPAAETTEPNCSELLHDP